MALVAAQPPGNSDPPRPAIKQEEDPNAYWEGRDLSQIVLKGWDDVKTRVSEHAPPGPRVGATLSCLKVVLRASDLDRHEAAEAKELVGEQQYGIFLFGGDDVKGDQTETLYVFYLQDRQWKQPKVQGKQPSKRSRHTATVVESASEQKQRLLIFGGVGASNAVSVLDPELMEWSQPPSHAKEAGGLLKAKKMMKKKAATEKAAWLTAEDDAVIPCARFGHSACQHIDTVYVFGGQDFKGPLADLYELKNVGKGHEPVDWVRPEVPGMPPPPSAMHSAAVMKDHMLLVGGEPSWKGFIWALQLTPSPAWLRTTLSSFPLQGVSRHALVEYVTPRPHAREEVIIFGGVIGREVHNAFFTLDVRGWKEESAEQPRETWAQIEERLREEGKDDSEVSIIRMEWEEHVKREQKQLKRKGRGVGLDSAPAAEADEEEGYSQEVAKEDEEWALPPEIMRTLHLGEWTPLQLGREPPEARFGHCMAKCDSTLYMYGGRTMTGAIESFMQFDATPLLWRSVPSDGDTPGSRVSHRTLLIGHYMYVLGGGSGSRSFNDLRRLDLYTMRWELMPTRGEGPSDKPDAIIGPSLIYVEPYLVVFGGGDGRRPSNDLHTLDMQSMLWRRIETEGAPPAPRVGHSATQLGQSMVVFGGFSKGKYFHDVHTLDVEKLGWSQFIVTGPAPHGRVSHTATLVGEEVLIFGGSAGGACYNDVVLLSNQPAEKRKKRGEAEGPSGRGRLERQGGGRLQHGGAGPSPPPSPPPTPPPSPPSAMVPYQPPSGDIVPYKTDAPSRLEARRGGEARREQPISNAPAQSAGTSQRRSNAEQRCGVWKYPEVAGTPPKPRFSHSASHVGNLLFVVGGLFRKGKASSEVHVLQLSLMEWSQPRVSLEGPAPRGRHTAEAYGTMLLIFGGGAEGKVFDDMWALDIDGSGMVRLEQAATKAGLDSGPSELEQRKGLESVALSFLLPQMGERPPVEVAPEYDDVEAREADADEVSCWLQHLGLGEHAYAFAAHEIDLEVLTQLEEPDLLDVGVHDPTQRLRLLRGIEVLRARGSLSALGRPGERLFRKRFRLGCEINFGGSPALLAVDTRTDRKVVVKFLHSVEEYYRQLALHRQLKGEQVVRLVEAFESTKGHEGGPRSDNDAPFSTANRGWGMPCLVLEYGDSSLGEFIGRGLLPPTERKAVFEAVLHVVLAIHARGLAHCALQPDSFRLYDGTSWRLVNLESCTPFGEPTPRKCPVCFAPPEVVRHLRAPKTAASAAAVDVWALGALLWQLYTQQPLFTNENEATTLLGSHAQLQPPIGGFDDPQAYHLLLKMLQKKPAERIEAALTLKHSYLAGGVDTVEMEASFGPMQKGHLFLRSLLNQMRQPSLHPAR